ncbi:hypothetical protein [Mycolicibacterium vaccae]|uniref:hypothetical protein n=1 Tax=Mycolicibacterium vaccae TaxID=1810 RepID=UPI003D073A4A
MFETTTPGGHHGSEVRLAPRLDGSATLRVVQGEHFLDVPLTVSQCDELATVLLDTVYSAQQRRHGPDAASWQAQRNA